MRVLFVFLLLCSIIFPLHAQNLIAGQADVPRDLLPRVANTTITSLFGGSLGTIAPDGRYTIPVSQTGDVDMLFIKNPQTNEIIMLGYGYDGFAQIGLEGTALAMLMMFNPLNGTLDIQGKKDLLQAYRSNPAFPQMLQAVKTTVAHQGEVATPNDQALIKIIAAIQNSTPQAQQKSAMYDPAFLMGR